MSPKSPEKLEIRTPDMTLVFEKKDGTWLMREPLSSPADAEAVQELLSSLQSLSVGESLTRREESHALYQVDDSSGIKVQVWGTGEKEPASWILGKMAPDFNHIYLRVPGQPAVHLAQGVQRTELEKSLSQWRDRRIVILEPEESLTRLQVELGKASFQIQKSSDQWTRDGKMMDSAKVQALTSAILELNADDFIDGNPDLKKLGLISPRAALRLETSSGRVLRLQFGDQDKETQRVPVQYGEEASLFWIADYKWDDLASALKDF